MYILDIIPLALLPRHQDQLLSYYHTTPLAVGAIVAINFNHRKIKGVVVGSDTIKNRKLIFKKSVNFELKNISGVISTEPQISEQQLKIAKYLSDYYYAPLGVCLKTILPPFFNRKTYNAKLITPVPSSKFQVQRFILIPEKILADHYIAKYGADAFISGASKTKEYFAIWQKIASGEIRTIVGTRVGLFLPFTNLEEIIVEDESNEAYKSDMMPRYHAVDLAGFIAKLHGAKISHYATVPRLETWQGHPASRMTLPGNFKTVVINMISEIKAGNFSIFSRELKDELYKIQDTKYKILLFIPRRGHANFLLCEKCEQVVKCPNCSASLVVHYLKPRTPDAPVGAPTWNRRGYNLEPALICHHCHYSQPWPKSCLICDGHKFKSYGVGIEKVISELKKFYQYANLPLPKILQLDSDSVADEITEQKIVADFMQGDSVILVATQMLFSQQPLIKADICDIISADTLINIPDFRAEESLFRQIYTLGSMVKEFIIQTRNPDDPAIQLATKGDPATFFANELAVRQDFHYPPFSQLIKLTYRHRDPVRARKEALILAEKLKSAATYKIQDTKYEILGPSPAFISQERSQYVWNIILKIKNPVKLSSDNHGAGRNELLRLVPSGWTIDVDPRTIL